MKEAASSAALQSCRFVTAMETQQTQSLTVVVADTTNSIDAESLQSALLDLMPTETRLCEIVRLEDRSQWPDWIGRMPAGFGLHNTCLALAVSAYRHTAATADDSSAPLGAAIVADPTGGIIHVAAQTCSRSELHAHAPRSLGTGSTMATTIASRVRDAVREPTVDAASDLPPESLVALQRAPDLLADVWHGRRPAVWSEEGGPWSAAPPRLPGGVLSGSFHPLHAGHAQLRDAAEQFLGNRVEYEMPIANADKPSLDFVSIGRRCGQFTDSILAVSNAATFLEKSRFLAGVTFVVGADTAERILDPRFYGGDPAAMKQALEDIGSAACRFLVAGRRTPSGFQTIRDIAVPANLAGLFVELPESKFRMDISSTESRRRSNH